jgi:hypothetical protein
VAFGIGIDPGICLREVLLLQRGRQAPKPGRGEPGNYDETTATVARIQIHHSVDQLRSNRVDNDGAFALKFRIGENLGSFS